MSARKVHWTETADRVTSGCMASHPLFGMLAEGDDGRLYVPLGIVGGEPYWRGVFRWWNPFHWPAWLRSRLTNRIAWIELDR
jgi:hypothetical protein